MTHLYPNNQTMNQLGSRQRESDITALLSLWNKGDDHPPGDLFPAVYGELRRLAHRLMRRERSDHTLDPTALVHEAYVRLVDGQKLGWQDRGHFYAVTAQLMRRILVDHARGLQTERRGGACVKLHLEDWDLVQGHGVNDLLELNEALGALETVDARKARVIELRFFGGLSVEETATVLDVSKPTVILDTRLARAWLFHYIHGEKPRGP